MPEKPTPQEIKQARSILARSYALSYWEKLRDNPELYKERLKQVRHASQIAAKARKERKK